MRVRAAYPAELPVLAQQMADAAWGELTPRERPAATTAAVARQADALVRACLAQPTGTLLVAEANGTPIGHILYYQHPNPLSGRVDGVLMSLQVTPSWRRRGVARSLVRAAEQQLLAQGVRGALLVTALHNTAAMQWMTALGYWPERVVWGKEL